VSQSPEQSEGEESVLATLIVPFSPIADTPALRYNTAKMESLGLEATTITMSYSNHVIAGPSICVVLSVAKNLIAKGKHGKQI